LEAARATRKCVGNNGKGDVGVNIEKRMPNISVQWSARSVRPLTLGVNPKVKMINQKEIEHPRTPAELRQFVAEIRARVEADPEELKIARRKVGLYKMFVDEIIPLSLSADYICENHDLLKPVVGNQGYDVIVLAPDGTKRGKVEIAKPYDGKANAEDVKLLEKRTGFGKKDRLLSENSALINPGTIRLPRRADNETT
jgi:hypothetical protein